MHIDPQSSEADTDLIWKAARIAQFIRRPEYTTRRMLIRGELPARRVGKNWVASRSQLRAFLMPSESQAA